MVHWSKSLSLLGEQGMWRNHVKNCTHIPRHQSIHISGMCPCKTRITMNDYVYQATIFPLTLDSHSNLSWDKKHCCKCFHFRRAGCYNLNFTKRGYNEQLLLISQRMMLLIHAKGCSSHTSSMYVWSHLITTTREQTRSIHIPVLGLALGVDLSSRYTTPSAEKSCTTSCAAFMEVKGGLAVSREWQLKTQEST